jgi:hypothetical protein
MMTILLVDYYKNLECQQLREDFEKVKLLMNAAKDSEKDGKELY